MERGLHRRRSRRRQRDVGRREHGVRVALDDGHPGGDGLHWIEQPIGEMRRARDDELDRGDLRAHEAGRGREIGKNPRHFIRPASRQDRHRRRRRGQTVLREKAFARHRRRRQIDERMADELDRHPAFPIDRFLERKDHQDPIRDPTDRLQPAGTPGPDLRADVIDDRHAELLDGRREAEIEVGRIDDDERVGTLGARRRDQAAQCGKRTRHFRNRFRQPGDGDVAIVVDQAAPGGFELRAAEAGDGQRWLERAQLAGQRAGIEIAGGFTARQQKPNAQEAGRLNSAGSIGVLNWTSVTFRSIVTGPALREAVKGICTPSTTR